jgi:hypothetical protein
LRVTLAIAALVAATVSMIEATVDDVCDSGKSCEMKRAREKTPKKLAYAFKR